MPDNVVSLNEFGSSNRYLSHAERLSLLHGCRDQLIEGVCRILTRQTASMESALLSLAERSPLLESRNSCFSAQQALNKHANETILACKRSFLSTYDQATNGGTQAPRQNDPQELSLVGDEDYESILLINKATSRLRFNCAEQLVTLDSRMGMLLEHPNLAEEENPLGPRLLCEALLDGLVSKELDKKSALVLLNQFELVLSPELPALYKTINHYLIDKGILPDIKVGQGARPQSQQLPDHGNAGTDDFNKLFDLIAGSSGHAAHGMPSHAFQAGGGSGSIGMLEAIGKLQNGPLMLPTGAEINFSTGSGELSNVLRQLQQSPIMLGASNVEILVVDAVAMLFDIVFDEEQIAGSLKNLLSRLQLPVLKAALLDRNFFSNRHHPARKLLDAISDLATGMPPSTDKQPPHFAELEAVIDHVVNEFVDDTVVFEQAAEEVHRIEYEHQSTIEAGLSESIEDLQRAERAETAGIFIHDQVTQALEGQPVMPSLLRFLHSHWSEVMSKTYVTHGPSAPQLTSEMETMRELIWSVQPKTDMDMRLMLVRILPGMLKRLRDGLSVTSIQTEEIERFFAELVVQHANAVRAQLPSAAIPLPESEMDPNAPAVIESHSEQVDLPSPPPPQVHVQAEVEDVFTERARAIRKGDWVEFHYDDGTFRWARMAFSSGRGNYLFTDQDGINTFSISLHRLADKLRNGQAVLVVQHSVTETAFGKLMNFFRAKAVPAPA